MDQIFLCAITALSIYSAPANDHIVGIVQYNQMVQIQDTSPWRDYVFVGDPGWDKNGQYLGVRSRGWIKYSGLTECPNGGEPH